SCPICEQPIASTAVHCSVCGFPTRLAIEGLRSNDGEADTNAASAETTPSSPPNAKDGAAPRVLSPEQDLNAAISRDLRSKMELVRELGRGAPDLTNELCQAALSEADGRASEALAILRSAQNRLEADSDELVQRRLTELGQRREALERTGARVALGEDLRAAQQAVEAGEREEAIRKAIDTDRRLTQFESDWRGLQGLLAQVEGLRSEAAELGIPLGEITGEIEAIREKLREPNLTGETLDALGQEAAQTLMLLHEAVPSALTEELERAEKTIDQYPEDHVPSAVAKRLHLEATRHLKKGRLPEAVRSVQELRRELAELQAASAAGTPLGAPTAPTAPETEDEMLDRLLKKAWSLASRIRTLPPDSDIAHDAAVEIREATEFLRSRMLKEADLTLTRLMRILSTESGRS
ncbi:MAG TPA: hypothetical protein VMH38_07560, partial [Thermoplasmata archaeon]|nr:hypothetical protein [Thermoplasmata archaeon]